MHSNGIEHRITDLLKLAGVTNDQTLEELTDHYLTHIEEEVKRGVNSQKAVRETYQEIANLDVSNFTSKKKLNKRGLILFFLLFVGLALFFLKSEPKSSIPLTQNSKADLPVMNPPTGYPIHYSEFTITSEFGLRNHPIHKHTSLHKGIDIRAEIGTSVLATGSGTIQESGYSKKKGNYIVIQHNQVYSTKYFHLSQLFVNTQDQVLEGQIIGSVGNTGISTMPHLHYEILKDNAPINPREIIAP